MSRRTDFFEIPGRFRGPPRSGNGGYTCGLVARHLPGTVSVRLHAPPPLDTKLRLEPSLDQAQLYHDDILVAEAKPAEVDLAVPPAPAYGEAEEAASHYAGFRQHDFPGCFVCGPGRAPGDGLRIFPGPLAGGPLVAAPWVPDESLVHEQGRLRPEFLWSALDCTGGIAVLPGREGISIVLGELAVKQVSELSAGEPCVVIGWPLNVEGRKRRAGSAVYAPGGCLVAVARATWIEVPAGSWC